jgi:zinc protease
VSATLASFSGFRLSNGIQVVVKRNPASRVAHLLLVLRGGSLLASKETAGIESLALKTMARASASIPHQELQTMLDETSSSIRVGVGLEASYYSLTCLDKYFPRLFPAWAGTLTDPAFAQTDFDQVATQARIQLQGRERDPWSKTTELAQAEFFKGHPFSADPDGSLESVAAARLDAVKAWYRSSFSANRMFIVAVGDFDTATLKAGLEAALGRIPDLGLTLPPAAPKLEGPEQGALVSHAFPQSRGIAYLLGEFPAPGPGESDYLPLKLAMMAFEDLLMAVVREEHGAVYTPSADIFSHSANYGSIAMYKTGVPGKIKAYIDEAAASMGEGLVADASEASVGGDAGEASLVGDAAAATAGKGGGKRRSSLAEALPVYKALFESKLYGAWRSNGAVAGRIAESILATGNYSDYLRQAESLGSVSAEQVSAAFRKYLLGGRISWVVLGPPELIGTVSAGDYLGLGSR